MERTVVAGVDRLNAGHGHSPDFSWSPIPSPSPTWAARVAVVARMVHGNGGGSRTTITTKRNQCCCCGRKPPSRSSSSRSRHEFINESTPCSFGAKSQEADNIDMMDSPYGCYLIDELFPLSF
uniref:Uncharacterized protein n=1 Tax=Oryza punctata TaxID=4537 RepID=A0A0E0JDA7_ORYPU